MGVDVGQDQPVEMCAGAVEKQPRAHTRLQVIGGEVGLIERGEPRRGAAPGHAAGKPVHHQVVQAKRKGSVDRVCLRDRLGIGRA
jgi:hypothetical protein